MAEPNRSSHHHKKGATRAHTDQPKGTDPSGDRRRDSYRVADNVSGTMVPATADHPDAAGHVRGTHLRTEPAPTSLGSNVAGGRVIVR